MEIIITNPDTGDKRKLCNYNGLCYEICRPCKNKEGIREWASPKSFPSNVSYGISLMVRDLMRHDNSKYSLELEEDLINTEKDIINSFVDKLLVEVIPEKIKDTKFVWNFEDNEYFSPTELLEDFQNSEETRIVKIFSDYEILSLEYSRIKSAVIKLKLGDTLKVQQKEGKIIISKI